MSLILNGLVGLSTTLAGASAAIQGGDPRSQSTYVTDLQKCQAIAADAERVRCYDESVAKLLQASRAGQVSVIDQQQAREVRRSLFGFSVPKLAIFGGGDGEEAKELTAKVTRVRQSPDGRFTVQVEGGAWWETVQRPDAGEGPRIGSTVRLRKAALGSYFMNIDGNRAVRARRVQ